jgi:ankyrin repeat protein
VKRRKIVAGIISIALIVLMVSVYFIWFAGPSETEVRFLQACQAGSVEHVTSMLAENPRLLNCHSAGHVTALHYVAFSGNMKLVRYMVQRGADVKAETTGGETSWPNV